MICSAYLHYLCHGFLQTFHLRSIFLCDRSYYCFHLTSQLLFEFVLLMFHFLYLRLYFVSQHAFLIMQLPNFSNFGMVLAAPLSDFEIAPASPLALLSNFGIAPTFPFSNFRIVPAPPPSSLGLFQQLSQHDLDRLLLPFVGLLLPWQFH